MIRFSTQLTALSTLAAATLFFTSGVASAQEAAKPAKERPQIRLSEGDSPPGEKPQAAPTERPAPEKKEKPAAVAEPAAPEEKVLPETPESEVGVGPKEGLGPAEPTVKEEVEEEGVEAEGEDEDLSQPRIIDTSKEKEDAAPPPPPEPKIPGSQLPFTYHLRHVDVSAGLRFVGTTDAGLEPFLVDPVMADLYLRGGMAFALTDRIAFAPHIEFGGTGSSATVRNQPSEISKAHLTLGLEGRYHFIHRMFGYVRVAPGLEFVNASIGLEETSTELSNDNEGLGSVAFQTDMALGASLRLFGSNDGRKRDPRLWAFTEAGYRFSTAHKLSLAIDPDLGPRRATTLELSPLDFSGGFFSLGLMASF